METRDIVHRGINQDQGHDLLVKKVEDIERRKENVKNSIELFGCHAILDNKLKHFRKLKNGILTHKFWLIRESSNAPNLLAVDFIRFDRDIDEWILKSHRLAYTLTGWQSVDDDDQSPTIGGCLEMNADLAMDYVDSLLLFLDKFRFYDFMLLLPQVVKPEATHEPVYTILEM